MVVRDAPAAAVAHAVDELVAQGFEPEPALEAALTRRAPTWSTRVVAMGDDGGTWRRGLLADAADLVTFGLASDLLPRKVERTWVVVTARTLASGTELTLAPLAGRLGQTDAGGMTARPFLDAAATALAAGYRGPGALVEEPTSAPFVTDRDSPAFPRTFRQVLGEVRRGA